MQNYVQMWLATGNVDYGGPVLAQTFVGDTEANMQAQFDGTGGTWAAGSPIYRGIVWILLNKSNVIDLCAQAFGQQATTVPGGMVFSAGSPKGEWNSDATGLEGVPKFVNYGSESATGYVSKPLKDRQASFSGAKGLIDFVNALPAYARLLRAEKRPRDAGIVLFVYDQLIAGKLAVLEGIAILRANNL